MVSRAPSGHLGASYPAKLKHWRLPVFMVCGSKAVFPSNIAFRAPCVEAYEEGNSNRAREDAIDRIEEERLSTCVRTAKYQESMRQYYKRNLHPQTLEVRDLILHKKKKSEGMHKLSSPWEGPFLVKEKTRPGSFRLCTLKGATSWLVYNGSLIMTVFPTRKYE